MYVIVSLARLFLYALHTHLAASVCAKYSKGVGVGKSLASKTMYVCSTRKGKGLPCFDHSLGGKTLVIINFPTLRFLLLFF